MKKNSLFLILIYISLVLSSCSSDKDEIPVKYELGNAKSSIEWVAYKTTDKVAVKGSFSSFKIISHGDGSTVKEAIENAEFSIPVSSIVSDGREYNIINFFFKAMDNTSFLSGKIKLTNDTTGYAEIKMNESQKNYRLHIV